MTSIEDLARYIYARMPSETPEDARTTWDDLTEQQRDIYRAHARNAALTFPDQHHAAADEARGRVKPHAADDITARARAALEGVTDNPMIIHLVDAGEVVGLLRELLAEVERLRAEHDPAHCYHCTRCADADDSQREGYKRSQAEIERLRGALDGLVAKFRDSDYYGVDNFYAADLIEAVLRGDQ